MCNCEIWHYIIDGKKYCYDCGLQVVASLDRGTTHSIEVRKLGFLASTIEVIE